MSNAYEWIERLLTEGKPVAGSVSAVALPELPAGVMNAPIVTWSLTRALNAIPGLVHEASLNFGIAP